LVPPRLIRGKPVPDQATGRAFRPFRAKAVRPSVLWRCHVSHGVTQSPPQIRMPDRAPGRWVRASGAVSAGWRRRTPKHKHFDRENRRAFFSLFACEGKNAAGEKWLPETAEKLVSFLSSRKATRP